MSREKAHEIATAVINDHAVAHWSEDVRALVREVLCRVLCGQPELPNFGYRTEGWALAGCEKTQARE